MCLIEIELLQLAATLFGVVPTRMLQQHPPHELRGDATEMGAAFPINPVLVD